MMLITVAILYRALEPWKAGLFWHVRGVPCDAAIATAVASRTPSQEQRAVCKT